MPIFPYTYEDDEKSAEPITVELPAHFEVCSTCQGDGKSSAHLGAFTSSEWAEQDDDFKEAYLGGKYDRQCKTCKGQRVVPVVDREACKTPEQKAALEHMDAQAEYERDRRSEQRMRDQGYQF